MCFYVMWSWSYYHESDGRCLFYFEVDLDGRLLSLFPFCYAQPLLYQGTQLNVSIQLQ